MPSLEDGACMREGAWLFTLKTPKTHGSDPAYTDSVHADPAYTDSAYADSAYVDSAYADSAHAESPAVAARVSHDGVGLHPRTDDPPSPAGAIVMGFDGASDSDGMLVLPSTLGGMPVVAVGEGAFAGRDDVRAVEFPDTLVVLAEGAFCSSGLEWVALPPSLRTIGKRAFADCRRLADVGFDEGLTSIGAAAFRGAPLRCISLPATLRRIEGRPFDSGSARGGWHFKLSVAEENPHFESDGHCLYELISPPPGTPHPSSIAAAPPPPGTPSPATSAAVSTPRDSGDVRELVLRWHWAVEASCTVADGCTRIASGAFAYDTMLRTVTLPETLREVGPHAFEGCTSLRRVDLPEGLTSIGERAFSSSNLASLTLPATLFDLGDRAFCSAAFADCKPPSIEVAEGNPTYRTRGGLLLEETSCGMRALGHFGPEAHLVISADVTELAALCLCNSPAKELTVTLGRLRAAPDSFAGMAALEVLHLAYAAPTASSPLANSARVSPDAFSSPARPADTVAFPAGDDSAALLSRCLRSSGDSPVTFDFHAYDEWLADDSLPVTLGAERWARCALSRLTTPTPADDALRNSLADGLSVHASRLCTSFARTHDFPYLDALAHLGLCGRSDLDATLRGCRAAADTEAIAWLTSLVRDVFGTARPDLSLH